MSGYVTVTVEEAEAEAAENRRQVLVTGTNRMVSAKIDW